MGGQGWRRRQASKRAFGRSFRFGEPAGGENNRWVSVIACNPMANLFEVVGCCAEGLHPSPGAGVSFLRNHTSGTQGIVQTSLFVCRSAPHPNQIFQAVRHGRASSARPLEFSLALRDLRPWPDTWKDCRPERENQRSPSRYCLADACTRIAMGSKEGARPVIRLYSRTKVLVSSLLRPLLRSPDVRTTGHRPQPGRTSNTTPDCIAPVNTFRRRG